ncbi:hypothetical protein HW555_002480 [Spodoptera exigua]|uniref:MULE transposase domain-containing protein n=1 Tax=Spodoptera exigua TaxID=7107 RepID=A0A835L7V4_SPOEX|nr:hypothetical protein HW555_002480 [Spodoptera exigua]
MNHTLNLLGIYTKRVSSRSFAHSEGINNSGAAEVTNVVQWSKPRDSCILLNTNDFAILYPKAEPSTLYIRNKLEIAAVMSTLEEKFPEASIKGCFYHFNRAIWKKAEQLNLSKNKITRKHVALLTVLAHLPPEAVTDGYLYIMEDSPTDEAVTKFNDYFVKQWFENNLMKDKWCCYGERHRTTNKLEGWHAMLNRTLDTRYGGVNIALPLYEGLQVRQFVSDGQNFVELLLILHGTDVGARRQQAVVASVRRLYGYYPYMYPTPFVLGMVTYQSLEVRRHLALFKYVIRIIRGSHFNSSLLQNISFNIPLPIRHTLRPRRRTLFAIPESGTVTLKTSPLFLALTLINNILLDNESLDLFASTELRLLSSATRYLESSATPSTISYN